MVRWIHLLFTMPQQPYCACKYDKCTIQLLIIIHFNTLWTIINYDVCLMYMIKTIIDIKKKTIIDI